MGIEIDLAHEAAFELGGLVIRPPSREVVRGARVDVLQPRVMQVLVALARRRGEVVSHADLIAACWGGRFVGDDAIQRCVALLRRLAGSLGGFKITSVARVGYRLDSTHASPQHFESMRLNRRAALIGRDREMAALGELIGALADGQGGLALVSGDPGIGKTRLNTEAGAQAAQVGAFVLKGRCYGAPATEPYGPFTEIIEDLARHMSAAAFRRALGSDAAAIASLLPELHLRYDDICIEGELEPDQRARRLIVAVSDFLERVSKTRSLLLILDDLHWIDEASSLVLRRLGRRLEEVPILVLGAYRDVQHDMGVPFTDLLEECVRWRGVEVVSLKGLSQADTGSLVTALAGRPFARSRLVGLESPSAQVAAIHAVTKGNPFFIEAVTRHMMDEHQLLDADGCIRTDLQVDELRVSKGVRHVIDKRVERLSRKTREVLAAAAVLGMRFATEVLEAMRIGGADGVLEALGEAMRAGLLELTDGQHGFAHDLLRQEVLSQTSSTRRRRLHRRAADAIERVCGGDTEARAAEIAHHLAQAGIPDGDRQGVILRLRRGGEAALRSHAFEDASVAFTAALALAGEEPTTERATLLAKRGESRWASRRVIEQAIGDLEESISIFTRLDDPEAVAHVTTLAMLQYWLLSRIEDGLQACAHALGGLGDRRSGDRAILLAYQGEFEGRLRNYQTGEALLREAEQLAEELGDQSAIARVCDRRGVLHDNLGEFRIAVGYTLRSAAAAKLAGEWYNAAAFLLHAASTLFALMRWDEAEALIDEAETLAEQTGPPQVLKSCQLQRVAILARRDGRFLDDADRSFLRRIGDGVGSRAYVTLATDFVLAGQWEEAARVHERTLQIGDQLARREAWSELLPLKVRLGDRAGAETMLAEHWSAARSWPRYERRFLTSWKRDFAIARALLLLGRDAEAARFHAPFLEYSRRHGPMEAILATTATAAGRWAEAESYFAAALVGAERLPDLIALADYRVDWARMLLKRAEPGDRSRAVTLIGDAADRYAGMGMARHTVEARRVLEAN